MSAPQDLTLNVRGNSSDAVRAVRDVERELDKAKTAIDRTNVRGFRGLDDVAKNVQNVNRLERELKQATEAAEQFRTRGFKGFDQAATEIEKATRAMREQRAQTGVLRRAYEDVARTSQQQASAQQNAARLAEAAAKSTTRAKLSELDATQKLIRAEQERARAAARAEQAGHADWGRQNLDLDKINARNIADAERAVNRLGAESVFAAAAVEKLDRNLDGVDAGGVKKAGKDAKQAADDLDKASKSVDALAYKMRMTGFALSGALTLPLIGVGRMILSVGSDFESAFANVEKVIEGSAQQIAQLQTDIRGMAQEIPMSAAGIAEIMAMGGQLGIATEQLSAFTEVAIRMGTATNLSAEEAADSIARFLNITNQGMPATAAQFERVGSVVVDLGNKSASTEQEILRMAMRLAAAGTQIGLSQTEILGMSSALASLGIRAESGGSSFSRVMLEIANAVDSGGDALDQFAAVSGTSAERFTQVYREEPIQAISMFLEGLNNLREGGENLFPVLEGLDLNTIRVRDATLRASLGYELFADQIKIAAAEAQDVNALMKESEHRFETVGSQWQLLKNHASELAITLFQELRPGLLQVFEIAHGGLDALGGLVEFFGTLPAPVQASVIAFGGLLAVLPPILAFVGMMLPAFVGISGAFTTAAAGGGILGGVLTGLGALAGPVGIAIAAIAVGLYLAYQNSELFRDAVGGMWDLFSWGAIESAKAINDHVLPALKEIGDGLLELIKSPWTITINVVRKAGLDEEGDPANAIKLSDAIDLGRQAGPMDKSVQRWQRLYEEELAAIEALDRRYLEGQEKRSEAVEMAVERADAAYKNETRSILTELNKRATAEEQALAKRDRDDVYAEAFEQRMDELRDSFKGLDDEGIKPSAELLEHWGSEAEAAANKAVEAWQRANDAWGTPGELTPDAGQFEWEREAASVENYSRYLDGVISQHRLLETSLGSAHNPEEYFNSYFAGFDGMQMRLTTLQQIFPDLADGGVQAIGMLATAVDTGMLSADAAIGLFVDNGRLAFEELEGGIREQMSAVNDAIVTALAGDPETGEIDWMQVKGLQNQYAELEGFLDAAIARQRLFADQARTTSEQIIGMYGALGQMGTDASTAMGLWEQKQTDANTALEKNQELFDAGKITQEEYLANQELLTWAAERYGGAVLDESLAFIDAQRRMALYTAGLDELNRKYPEGQRDSKEYREELANLTSLVDPAAGATMNLASTMAGLAESMNQPIERMARLMLTLGLISEADYHFVVTGELLNEPITTGIGEVDRLLSVPRILKVTAVFQQATATLANDPVFGNLFGKLGELTAETSQQTLSVVAELQTAAFDEGVSHVDEQVAKARELTANAALDKVGFDVGVGTVDAELSKQRLLTVATFVDLAPFWAAIATINANLPMNSPALEGPLSVYPDWGFVTERMTKETQPGVDQAVNAISSLLPMHSPAARGTLSNYPNWGYVTERMARDVEPGAAGAVDRITDVISDRGNRTLVNWSWLFRDIDLEAEDAGTRIGQAVTGWLTDLRGIADGSVGQQLQDELGNLFDMKKVLEETGAPAEAIAEIDRQISDKQAEIEAIGKIVGTSVIQGIATEIASEEAGEKLMAALEGAFEGVNLDDLLDDEGNFDPSKLFGDVQSEIERLSVLRDAALELGLTDLAAKYQADLEALYLQYGILTDFLETEAVQAWIAEQEAIAASNAELEKRQALVDTLLATQGDVAKALAGGAEATQSYFQGVVDNYENAKEAVRMGELLGLPPEVMDLLYADLETARVAFDEASLLIGEALRDGLLDEETIRMLAETGGKWFQLLYDSIFGPGALAKLEEGWAKIDDVSFEALQQMIADGYLSGQELVDAVVQGLLSNRLSLQQAMQLLGDDLGNISEETSVMLLDTFRRLSADLATAMATGEGLEEAQAAYDAFMAFLQEIALATGMSIEELLVYWERLEKKLGDVAAAAGKSIGVIADAKRQAGLGDEEPEEETVGSYRAPGGAAGGSGTGGSGSGSGSGSAFSSLYGPTSPGAYGAAYRDGVRTWGQFETWVNEQVELGNAILDAANPQKITLTNQGYTSHSNMVDVSGRLYNPSTPEQQAAYLRMAELAEREAAGRPSLDEMGRSDWASGVTTQAELDALNAAFEETAAKFDVLDEAITGTARALTKSSIEVGQLFGFFDTLYRSTGTGMMNMRYAAAEAALADNDLTPNVENNIYLDSQPIAAAIEKRLLPARSTVRP